MDFFLNEDQKAIRQAIRELCDAEFAPRSAHYNENHEFPWANFKLLAENGYLNMHLPEPYGGGLDWVSYAIVIEELARACAVTSVIFEVHCSLHSEAIYHFGSDLLKNKYLPKLTRGELLGAYALTEPGAGSDAQGLRTSAVLSEDGKYWILNGTKQWITNSAFADVWVVYAKVDGEKISAFIVERTFPGVSVGPEEKKMGLHASSTCSLILEDARVPVENLLGEIGRGHIIAFNILNIGRWKLGAGVIGASKHIIKVAADYAQTRKAFGRSISEFKAVSNKLAEMNLSAYVNESMCYRSAGYIDANLRDLDVNADGREATKRIEEYAIECSINKVYGSESFDFIADEAVQIHGGYGFMDEYEVSTAYRDSRINRIFEGTNEINRLLIPGTLIKRTMKGELPLMPKLLGLQDELLNLEPFDGSEEPLAYQQFLIGRAKLAMLMLAGQAVQKYQMALEGEQEFLMGLADMAIEIYAMESAVLRALKGLASGKAGLKVAMATVYVQEAFEKIGAIGRRLLPALEEDPDMLRTQLSMLKRLTKFQPVNVIALKRQIAEAVLAKSGYVC